MNIFVKAWKKFTVLEEIITNSILVAITVLVFASAIARTMGHPLNWAVDISLLLFAWEVFLGGDLAIRNSKLIGVEIFYNKFPKKVQKILSFIFFCMIIAFCIFLTGFGVILCLDNTKRLFQVLPISYSWCTLCVPVGCLGMAISSCIKITEIIKTPLSQWNVQEAQ